MFRSDHPLFKSLSDHTLYHLRHFNGDTGKDAVADMKSFLDYLSKYNRCGFLTTFYVRTLFSVSIDEFSYFIKNAGGTASIIDQQTIPLNTTTHKETFGVLFYKDTNTVLEQMAEIGGLAKQMGVAGIIHNTPKKYQN